MGLPGDNSLVFILPLILTVRTPRVGVGIRDVLTDLLIRGIRGGLGLLFPCLLRCWDRTPVSTTTVEHTHSEHYFRVQRMGLRRPTRLAVAPHSPCLRLWSENPLRYLDLLPWSDQPRRSLDLSRTERTSGVSTLVWRCAEGVETSDKTPGAGYHRRGFDGLLRFSFLRFFGLLRLRFLRFFGRQHPGAS